MEKKANGVGLRHLGCVMCENAKFIDADGFCNLCPSHFGERIVCDGYIPYKNIIDKVIVSSPEKMCMMTNGGDSDILVLSKESIKDILNGNFGYAYAIDKDTKKVRSKVTIMMGDIIKETDEINIDRDEIPTDTIEVPEENLLMLDESVGTSGVIGHIEHDIIKPDETIDTIVSDEEVTNFTDSTDDAFEEINIDDGIKGMPLSSKLQIGFRG